MRFFYAFLSIKFINKLEKLDIAPIKRVFNLLELSKKDSKQNNNFSYSNKEFKNNLNKPGGLNEITNFNPNNFSNNTNKDKLSPYLNSNNINNIVNSFSLNNNGLVNNNNINNSQNLVMQNYNVNKSLNHKSSLSKNKVNNFEKKFRNSSMDNFSPGVIYKQSNSTQINFNINNNYNIINNFINYSVDKKHGNFKSSIGGNNYNWKKNDINENNKPIQKFSNNNMQMDLLPLKGSLIIEKLNTPHRNKQTDKITFNQMDLNTNVNNNNDKNPLKQIKNPNNLHDKKQTRKNSYEGLENFENKESNNFNNNNTAYLPNYMHNKENNNTKISNGLYNRNAPNIINNNNVKARLGHFRSISSSEICRMENNNNINNIEYDPTK